MTSQLVIFRAFFIFFFVPPTLNLKKNSRKSTNKKILALHLSLTLSGEQQTGISSAKMHTQSPFV